MKKILICLVLTILLLGGCSDNSDQEVITIKMAAMRDIAYVPYVYAVEQGMYEEAGIDLQIDFFDSAKDRNAAWDTGDYDVETADLTAGALLTSLGDEITITGAPGGVYKFVSSPEIASTYNGDISSLDGMSVGISENTVIEFYVDYISEQYGIEFDKQPIPSIPDRYQALLSGEIDLAILPDPFPTMAIAEGSKLIWNSYEEEVPQLGALNWNQDFVDTDIMQTFLNVTDASANELNESGSSSYKEIAIANGLIEEQYFTELTTGLEFGESITPSNDTWNQVTSWAYEKGMIDNKVEGSKVLYQN